MKKTYAGGCHCGAVRYEADMDLSQGTFRCNCSICSKGRAWLTTLAAGDFRLLQGADALSVYQFGSRIIAHSFCKNCGIKCFGRFTQPDGQQIVAVSVSTLENISDAELAALPVQYVDGRHDNFGSAPAETRHL